MIQRSTFIRLIVGVFTLPVIGIKPLKGAKPIVSSCWACREMDGICGDCEQIPDSRSFSTAGYRPFGDRRAPWPNEQPFPCIREHRTDGIVGTRRDWDGLLAELSDCSKCRRQHNEFILKWDAECGNLPPLHDLMEINPDTGQWHALVVPNRVCECGGRVRRSCGDC